MKKVIIIILILAALGYAWSLLDGYVFTSGKIKAEHDSSYFVDRPVEEVKNYFKEQGFNDIRVEKDDSYTTKEARTVTVTIGDEEFKAGRYYSPDKTVAITYVGKYKGSFDYPYDIYYNEFSERASRGKFFLIFNEGSDRVERLSWRTHGGGLRRKTFSYESVGDGVFRMVDYKGNEGGSEDDDEYESDEDEGIYYTLKEYDDYAELVIMEMGKDGFEEETTYDYVSFDELIHFLASYDKDLFLNRLNLQDYLKDHDISEFLDNFAK